MLAQESHRLISQKRENKAKPERHAVIGEIKPTL